MTNREKQQRTEWVRNRMDEIRKAPKTIRGAVELSQLIEEYQWLTK